MGEGDPRLYNRSNRSNLGDAIEPRPTGQDSQIPARDPDGKRIKTAFGQPFKAIFRRAKKIQVRMPSSFKRMGFKMGSAKKKPVHEVPGSSMLAVNYDDTQEGDQPELVTRLPWGPRPCREHTQDNAQGGNGGLVQGLRRNIPPSRPRRSDEAGEIDEALPMLPDHLSYKTARSRYSDEIQQATPDASLVRLPLSRFDTLDTARLSDAPTYSTGAPPPAYQSQRQSELTTSSFGCVDGLPTEQREGHVHKAADRKGGVRGKFKKMQKALLFKK